MHHHYTDNNRPETVLSTVRVSHAADTYLTLHVEAREYDAEVMAVDEAGDVLWTVGHATGEGLSFEVVDRSIRLPAGGTYHVVIRGSASDLKVDVQWRIESCTSP